MRMKLASLGLLMFFGGAITVEARPMVAYHGGFESCKEEVFRQEGPKGMELYRRFLVPLFAKYERETGENLAWVVSCFSGNRILFYLSSNDQEMLDVHENNWLGLAQRIDELAKATGVSHRHILGHSHGGWLALKLVQTLQGPRSLVTIDPISRRECTFEAPRNCTIFPPDITRVERLFISRHTAYWDQFYQVETPFLRSSPVAEADRNIKSALDHANVRYDPLIWDDLERRLLAPQD